MKVLRLEKPHDVSLRNGIGPSKKKKGVVVQSNNATTVRRDDERQNAAVDKSTHSSTSINESGVTTVFSYRLSCAFCDANVDYVGDTKRKVAYALGHHYVELWHSLQEKRRGVRFADGASSDSTSSNNFGNSSLGQHLLEHCHAARSEDETAKWCQDNLRVQVKRHMYETRKTDGTFSFAQEPAKPKFVANKRERETEWEEKKKREALHKKEQRARDKDNRLRDTFDVVWNERYEDLVEYADGHGGDTRVPQNYGPDLRLGRWSENQRIQYRRKRNGTDGRPAPTDAKEELLNDVGFAWSLQPETRNCGLGIAVIYGYAPVGAELASFLPEELKKAIVDRPADFPRLVDDLLKSTSEDEKLLSMTSELQQVLGGRLENTSLRSAMAENLSDGASIVPSLPDLSPGLCSIVSDAETRDFVLEQLSNVPSLGRRVRAGLFRRAA